MNKRCIYILCGGIYDNEYQKKIVKNIINQTKDSDIDVYLLYDKKTEFNIDYENIIEFTYDDYDNLFVLEGKPIYDGNIHIPFLEFAKKHNYDYYMFYEYDLFYTGNIVDLYDNALKVKADAYYPDRFIQIYDEDIYWCWMVDIKDKNKYPCDDKDLYHCMHNIFIYSKEAINKIDAELATGKWYGYHEWVLPSLIKHLGINAHFFKDDLNEVQLFYQIDQFYYSIIHDGINKFLPNSLYHPIKTVFLYNLAEKFI